MSLRSILTSLLLLLAAPASAQFDAGAVLGTVRDSSGGVLPGVSVTLQSVETGISSVKVTDERGNFEFPTARIGTYTLRSELQGFTSREVTGIKVDVGDRQRVDIELTVGAITEAVSVVGATPLLETDSSQRGQVITGEQTRALPLNGREYSQLALLTTGVRLSGFNNGSSTTPREGSFNINGLRSTFNNFLIDGVDNNAYGTSNQGFSNQVMQPPPDAIGEFKVVTNNMSAEYGRAAGGTVNVAYRSGTNQFHGSGWEFVRDTSMNAVGFFRPATGKPELNRNQFGGVAGGPLVRNRAFFFGDYEGFVQDRKVTNFATIANAAERQGILTVDVRDPRTGAVYPAGTPIPMTAFARKVLNDLPTPTSNGVANNYTVLQAFTNDTHKAGGKVDLQLRPGSLPSGATGGANSKPSTRHPGHAVGRRRQRQLLARNQQLALATTWVVGSDLAVRSQVRIFDDRRGQRPAGTRDDERTG